MSTRTLPIPSAHRELTVLIDDEALSRTVQLLAASVTKRVNRLASARLVFLDGDAASGAFPLADADQLRPGRRVELRAGANDAPVSVFHGVIVRLALRVREDAAPQVIVDCRHAATALAIEPRSACFVDQTDAAVITALLDGAGLSGDVARDGTTHAQLLQHRTTDWAFMLERAAASGQVVLTNDDTVQVRPPVLEGAPVCRLHFGATILAVDAEIDARIQSAGVTVTTWSPADQAPVSREAEPAPAEGPGNLSADDLATALAPPPRELRHAGLDEAEAQAWADTAHAWARLNKVSGRAKCEGIATINAGDRVTLAGVGARFCGDIWVSGVRHDFDTVQGWKTHVQFGGLPALYPRPASEDGADTGRAIAPGLQIGVVTSNEDPAGEQRVRIRLPLVDAESDGIWARQASLDAGSERGFVFRPEIGDEVVVGFLDGDPRHAVLLGMLHSSAKPAPIAGSDDNHEKGYRSRSGLRLAIDDQHAVLRLDTPAGNHVTLSEQDEAVTIADQHGNAIELTADGIVITSAAALTLKAATELTLESGTALSAVGGTELTLEGTASAELSCAATTAIKGGTVQIN